MSSPSKKPPPKKGEPVAIEVGPSTIIDVFKAVYGPENVNDQVSEEFFNLLSHDRLRLEAERDILLARRQRRIERREEKRQREEERRRWEMRNNPQNLSLCAAQIQKYWRMIPMRRSYLRVLSSLGDHQRKKAIIIIGDGYEDRRVRAPTQTTAEALEMVRILQGFNFIVDVYSCAASNPNYYPTKANISAALADAAKTPLDTMLWVHVCGLGATGTVHGKNPHKEAELEKQKLRTPRTRLLHALQTSHRAPGQGVSAGDVRHFFLPSDARSGRLTFESVVSLEEVLDVLHPRHSEIVYDRPLHQRLVTMDIAEMGAVEGQQGGGFAVFASSSTGESLFEMTPAVLGHQLIEPRRATLSWGIVQCLLGEAWIYNERREQASLTAANMCDFIERLLDAQGVSALRKGKRWGDIPIVLGDRGAALHSFYTKAFGRACVGIPGPGGSLFSAPIAAPPDEQLQSAAGGKEGEAKKRAKPVRKRRAHDLRPALCELVVRVDLTAEASRINPFDTDFATILGPWLHVQSQVDHTLPSHRQPKVVVHRVQQVCKLTVGIAGTFVDVAAKCKTRGGEMSLWDDAASCLVQDIAPAPTVDVCLGHAEEGGVALVTWVSSWSEVQGIIGRLEAVAALLGGIPHSSIFLDVGIEATCFVNAIDQLNLIARGIVPVARVQEAAPALPSVLSGTDLNRSTYNDNGSAVFNPEDMNGSIMPTVSSSNALLHNNNSGKGGVTPPNAAAGLSGSATSNNNIAVAVTSHNGVDALQYVTHELSLDPLALEQQLDNLLVNAPTLRNRNWVTAFAKQKVVQLIEASQLVQRLNDLDDQGMDALMRRERPQGNPVPYTHTGMAVVVVAFVGPSDLRLRQARELHQAASALEVFSGCRFLLWDVNEPLKNDPRDHFPRERLSKLLEAIKFNLGPSAFPALLLLDLFKKRYYRMRQPTPSPVFESKAIEHLCEEFVKGALGELLPPVKGCRVYGGGVASTKYALIAV